jgi:TonB family protein
MEAFATYLLKSVLWLTGFALVYILFLRNERYFMLKRIYLIAGILVSFLFPLISIHYRIDVPVPVIDQTPFMQADISGSPMVHRSAPDKSVNYQLILLIVYLAGMILLVFREVRRAGSLFKVIYKEKASDNEQVKLIRAAGFPVSFSFFNYIFINPSINDNEVKEIMNHELVHVRQKHWLDLLLAEILHLVQWVNPFVWIYSGFIRQNHEYLADEEALQRTSNPTNYRAALINQLLDSPVISLSNSFNYSLNKKRFDMMKKIITSPYRKMKVLFVLPVFAIIFYAFATPEYNYLYPAGNTLSESNTPVITDGKLKGVVINEENKPFAGVYIVVTGTNEGTTTDESGNFTIGNVQEEAFVVISKEGYKTQFVKANFKREMSIKLVKDPDYDKQVQLRSTPIGGAVTNPLVVIDGVISDKGVKDISPEDIESVTVRKDKYATDKYGDKGKDGVIEVLTKKKAAQSSAYMQFKQPDQTSGEEEPFVVVEQMPQYPGGEMELLKFIIENTHYPDSAKAANIQGRVVVRFIVNAEGNTEDLVVLKGVHPLLDKEAIRVVSMLKNFTPGSQGGKPVPVYFSVPVTFTLGPSSTNQNVPAPPVVVQERPKMTVFVDGVLTDKSPLDVIKELGHNMGTMSSLSPEKGLEKYGENGKNGVFDITTRKKAIEMGLKVPYPRIDPDDYPTFMGQDRQSFNDWLIAHIKYPEDAVSRGVSGKIQATYTIIPDGSHSNPELLKSPDKSLGDAVINTMAASPKWEPPKNPESTDPFRVFVSLKFELPDKITVPEEPFVVVEEMPQFTGGDIALLEYLATNIRYPEDAKKNLISGRVIIRFAVEKDGKVDQVSVLKGVSPSLDAEAVRVVNSLPEFKPGYQGGKPVPVWFSVPVTFTLTKADSVKTNP